MDERLREESATTPPSPESAHLGRLAGFIVSHHPLITVFFFFPSQIARVVPWRLATNVFGGAPSLAHYAVRILYKIFAPRLSLVLSLLLAYISFTTSRKMKGLFLLLGALLSTLSAASYIKPPVLPLFVRNPYLSLWYNARLEPWETWPIFWHGQEVHFLQLHMGTEINIFWGGIRSGSL